MTMETQPAYYGSLALSILGHCGILLGTILPYWRWSSWQISNPLYGRIPTFDGIWWQCMSLKAGGFTCVNYGLPSIFLDPAIQAARGLMTISCLCSFLPMLLNILIVDSCIILPADKRTRFILAMASAALHILTCICSLIATAYYSWRIMFEYFSPLYDANAFTYMLGPCLYAIWIGMFFGVISAIILIVGSCKDRGDSDKLNDNDFEGFRPPSITMPELTRPVQAVEEYI